MVTSCFTFCCLYHAVNVAVTSKVRRVDDFNREIVFTDGLTVKIDDVWNIRICENG